MQLTDAAFEGPLMQRGIGVIAPFDLALERELWRWTPLDVSLHLARTPYEPVEVSLEMAELVSSTAHLQSATRDVMGVSPEVVAYLCSSGSFIHGVDYEKSLRAAIQSAGDPGGVPSPGALGEAIAELRPSALSVVTPYGQALTGPLADFLAGLGVTVTSSHYLGLGGGIWKGNYRTVAEPVMAADSPDAEA